MSENKPSTITITLENESIVPPSASKLEDLPPRLLGKILAFIPTTNHAALKEVSPGWEKLIDEHIGVPAYIGRTSDYKLDRVDFSPTSIMTEIGISILNLINVHNILLPPLKFPNLVKHIAFTDYISERNFLQTLTPLTNLRHLSLDMSTCHYLEFYSIPMEFLSRLETLSICTGEYCSEWNEEINPSRNEAQITLDNLFSLLTRNVFRNIKSLLLGFPFIVPNSGNVVFTTSLFKFILLHAATLRHLEIFFDGKLECSDGQNPRTAIRDVDIDYDALASVTNLQDFYVNLHEYHRDLNILEPWLRLLEMQKELRRCIFIPRGGDDDDCLELPLPEGLLRDSPCASTLLVFKWFLAEEIPDADADTEDNDTDTRGTGQTVDCSLFQNCQALADLNLTSSGNRNCFVNMRYLPQSLQRVSFEGVRCMTDDIEMLATELPLLRNLNLTNVGEEGMFGMGIETLKMIYERKILKRLLVLDGFNKQSIRLASQQEEGSFSFLLMLLKSKFYEGDCYFHMKLCDNGEYAVTQ